MRRVPSTPSCDGVDAAKSFGFAAKSTHSLLAHLADFIRAAHADLDDLDGLVSHHDFHPLVFFLVLLERTLRHLTYPELSHCQKQWALHTATTLTRQLTKIWDQKLSPDTAASNATLSVSNNPVTLRPRFAGELWSAKRFGTPVPRLAWDVVYTEVARNRGGIIALLEKELVYDCGEEARHPREALSGTPTGDDEAKQRHDLEDLNRTVQERQALMQRLRDWLSLPDVGEAMKDPPVLGEEEETLVGNAIPAACFGNSFQKIMEEEAAKEEAAWKFFCSTKKWKAVPREGCYTWRDQDVWLYRPGEQLLIKEADGRQYEASVVEMLPDGRYQMRPDVSDSDGRGECVLRLTDTNHVIGACFSYPKGTRLCIFDARSSWRDATVRECIDESNMHRVVPITSDGGGADEGALILLNPSNHSQLRICSSGYDAALRKYRSFVRTRYSFITDALTGERLDIEDQIVNLNLVKLSLDASKHTVSSSHDALLKIARPCSQRHSGSFNDCRILIKAAAASGKTVMMRQFIHDCCKYSDQNDTVPILVLVIDLQRSMEKFAREYKDVEDLVAVFLMLNWKKHDKPRFDALMQVSPNPTISLLRPLMFVAQAYESRRALLLIDGIDEGGKGKSKERIETFITQFLVRQRVPLIVTTRPEGYTKADYTAFTSMELAPLAIEQQAQIVENRVGSQALAQIRPHLETMKDSEGNSICSNPLMLSMVISIFKSSGSCLPSTRYELYEKAVGTMLDRADFKELGKRTSLTNNGTATHPSDITRLLRKAAVHRHHARQKEIRPEHITQIVGSDETLRATHGHVEAQVANGKLPVLCCLETSPLKLQFAHLSFQEFLVAQTWVRYCGFPRVVGGIMTGFAGVPPLVEALDGWWHNAMRMAFEQSAACAAVIEAFTYPIHVVVPLDGRNPIRPFWHAYNPAIGIVEILLDNGAHIDDKLGFAVIKCASNEMDADPKAQMTTIVQRLLQQRRLSVTREVEDVMLHNRFWHHLVTLESSTAAVMAVALRVSLPSDLAVGTFENALGCVQYSKAVREVNATLLVPLAKCASHNIAASRVGMG